jgi:ABC-2 type transport system ATP-binding protein
MLGVVFQHTALDPHLTVAENLRDQASLFGISGSHARDLIDTELAAAGLSERRDTLVKTLSGGMRRRADLCRALLHHPRLLLLDEPTVGLDPLARESFLDELDRRRADHDLTVVMSTHLIDEADRQDRVVLLHHGRIVADGSPSRLRHELGERVLTVLAPDFSPPESAEANWIRRTEGWTRRVDHNALEVSNLAADLAARGVSFSIAPPTLADVFEIRTGASLEHDETTDASEEADR